MTNHHFPLSTDEIRIAAREAEYAKFCAERDAELAAIEIHRLNCDYFAQDYPT